jgi:ankyrin repeat protein
VQYCAFEEDDIKDICYKDFYDLLPSFSKFICFYRTIDLQSSSFKFLLKNKRFQVEATSHQKTWAAIRTLDLDFLKKYIEQVQPDLNEVLVAAAWIGFTDAVKLLLSDARVDPSARNNHALIYASENGHSEIVKLLLSDDRVYPSAQNNRALFFASRKGHLEIVKLLKSHPRFRK